ncbi:hypothetical protein BT96DRAFT_1010967 [Gymnopus androsaceus JB14]|uniref:Uncharacterized protein n=1 Tax=Gymnopus androsaceus JB14 TaxID=1447944 RepID=A0A6A4G9Y1_9AGAR|nr:hypothetical protein BT96DRAFT_1010967 [Gymnopus androsaceus JB14]
MTYPASSMMKNSPQLDSSVASATPVSLSGLTQTDIFLQQCAEAQAASQQALHELRQFTDTLAKANMPGFNPGSCNELDVKSTSPTVTSHHTMRLAGQSPCRDDPHENIRDTDGDQWADIAQTGLRPSCHPCSSNGEISPPDVSLTLPVSSSPSLTRFSSSCVNPHPELIQEKSFTPGKAMPSKLTVVHGTTVIHILAQPGTRKETGMDRVTVQLTL